MDKVKRKQKGDIQKVFAVAKAKKKQLNSSLLDLEEIK